MAPIARPPPVLADANLGAAALAEHARRHGHIAGRELRLTVAADEEHGGRERLAVLGVDAVDEQALALVDAVLLAADGDDRVAHGRGKLDVENAGRRPRAEG